MSINRLDRRFREIRQEGRKALIGYITAGYPDKRSLETLITELEKAGLDILELGIPFSDPIADGPTIQRSSQVALAAGTTLPWVFATVARLRSRVQLPLVFMTYSNPIVAYGIAAFFHQAERSGVDGVIVPDLITEEGGRFEREAHKHNVHLIFLAAPTTPLARMQEIGLRTRGFLYAVSLTGVTGARKALPKTLPSFLRKLRTVTKAPVAVGFGLSTPTQVREASRYADAVIVGSALVDAVSRSRDHQFKEAIRFVRSLKQALKRKEPSHAS